MHNMVLYGLVHPQRAQLTMSVPEFSFNYQTGISNLAMSVEIIWNQIMVQACLQDETYDKYGIHDAVRNAIGSYVDFAGMYNGFGYQIEITSIIDLGTKDIYVFGVDVPGFLPVDNLALDEWAQRYVPMVTKSAAVQLAVASYREAIRVPVDTGLHAYRAIESIMQEFKRNFIPHRSKSDVWEKMRVSLNVERSYIDPIQSHGAPPRHGKIHSITHLDRLDILSRSRHIIIRYMEFCVTECLICNGSPHRLEGFCG